jgi:hypothetical protein
MSSTNRERTIGVCRRDIPGIAWSGSVRDQRQTAVEHAWAAAERATEELGLGHYDRAAGAAAVAAAWAQVASAVRPI